MIRAVAAIWVDQKNSKLVFFYLASALLMPLIPLQQPPDAVLDYLPIRDLISKHFLEPSHWIPDQLAYRVPGYSFFLALLSLWSRSEFWIRLIQGLLLTHSLIIGSRLSKRYGGNPTLFQWSWTLMGVQFYFSQLLLSETLATWLLLKALENPTTLFAILIPFVKPVYAVILPILLWPWTKRWITLLALWITLFSWGQILKPKAGHWTFLGAGGGLNLFIATLPESFEHEGYELDRYWLREEAKLGSPTQMGWYAFDDLLKKSALKRFPHWNWSLPRFWSPFFGQQYQRGFQHKLIPFGVIMILGLFMSFITLQSELFPVGTILIFLFGIHWIIAPFARFLLPLAPLACLLISNYLSLTLPLRKLIKRSVLLDHSG